MRKLPKPLLLLLLFMFIVLTACGRTESGSDLSDSSNANAAQQTGEVSAPPAALNGAASSDSAQASKQASNSSTSGSSSTASSASAKDKPVSPAAAESSAPPAALNGAASSDSVQASKQASDSSASGSSSTASSASSDSGTGAKAKPVAADTASGDTSAAAKDKPASPAAAKPSTAKAANSSGVSALKKLDIQHVVIVIEENHSSADIMGNNKASYMNKLAKTGAWFTNSHGVTHPSQPNYIALFSGSTQGVKSDSCIKRLSGSNLATSLIKNKWGFKGYSEDLPKPGFTGCWAGSYGRKHNPWSIFSNVPSSSNLPFSDFPNDYSKLPTVSVVIPNVKHDMHDGTVEEADAWLQKHVSGYADWAKAHNSLLILTWDEDDFTKANHIPTIIVGDRIKPGKYDEHIDHYSVLSTVEALYGLPYLGHTDQSKAITDIWKTKAEK